MKMTNLFHPLYVILISYFLISILNIFYFNYYLKLLYLIIIINSYFIILKIKLMKIYQLSINLFQQQYYYFKLLLKFIVFIFKSILQFIFRIDLSVFYAIKFNMRIMLPSNSNHVIIIILDLQFFLILIYYI